MPLEVLLIKHGRDNTSVDFATSDTSIVAGGGSKKVSRMESANETDDLKGVDLSYGGLSAVVLERSTEALGDEYGDHDTESSSDSCSPGLVCQNPREEEDRIVSSEEDSLSSEDFVGDRKFFSLLTSATTAAAHSSHSSPSITASPTSELASEADD
mmetsp:Transcript_22722/g.52555  ORF Transcript_22722/g.52555 Transcript_22722/m.52555 type:complete len:156 (+) Transcript_22722:2677-3144(+)